MSSKRTCPSDDTGTMYRVVVEVTGTHNGFGDGIFVYGPFSTRAVARGRATGESRQWGGGSGITRTATIQKTKVVWEDDD